MVRQKGKGPPVDPQFGRGQETPLGIGQRKVAHDHLAIERAVEAADTDLHPVLEFIFLDLGDHETAPRVAVEADQEKRDECDEPRSEEHTSELQSLMRISYAVFCLKKKKE